MQLTRRRLLACTAGANIFAPNLPGASRRTQLSIVNGRWHLNGRVTYSGAEAEGLLMNVRMVNAVFEDANPQTRRQGFDPNESTRRFIQSIPEYVEHGIRAFTIGLQGGDPGYEGARNSAFRPDGALREPYLDRIADVIEACDRQGAAVIVSCFYQRQDQILRDQRAVRDAISHVARWLRARGFGNVLLEIANEFGHNGYNHPILKSPAGQVELIELARRTAPRLLVSTSGLGNGRMPSEVALAADYLTPHLNTTRMDDIAGRLVELKRFGKPVVVNEDDKTGDLGAQAARLCVAGSASWGFMAVQANQHYPFRFTGANDDPAVYATLKHLTTAGDYFPPSDAAGGWRAVTGAAAIRRETGLNRDKLDEAFAFIQGSTKNGGLLVLRKGWLAYERYFGLGHRDATPNLASCGKSFTSVAVGILLREQAAKFPRALDQEVFTPDYLPPEAFPPPDPRMSRIKLGHLLTMTAGIRGNNPAYVKGKQTIIHPAGADGSLACVDEVAFGRRDGTYQGRPYSSKSLWCAPGGGYSYATSSIHLASVVLRHVSGVELEQFVDSHLARPLGWGSWGYGYRQARELSHTPGGGGIALRATDMLRFGYLLARAGRWKDRQLIPRDYVLHCGRQSPYNPHYPYSLQFNVSPGRQEKAIPAGAFWKMGSGGHVLYVVPSQDLVIWKLGGRDGQYDPRDTGLPPSPAPADQVAARSGWKESVDADTACLRTLALVLAAIEDR